MRQEREEPFDPDQPTLVVTYGNTTRKHRPLDREVIVLGRTPGCDVQLVAAEVAPIHCLLLRAPAGGWRVRHFGGRIGTLVNGKAVQDAVADHDDTLQIGSFSFKFHLPTPFRRPGLKADTPPDSAEASHLRPVAPQHGAPWHWNLRPTSARDGRGTCRVRGSIPTAGAGSSSAVQERPLPSAGADGPALRSMGGGTRIRGPLSSGSTSRTSPSPSVSGRPKPKSPGDREESTAAIRAAWEAVPAAAAGPRKRPSPAALRERPVVCPTEEARRLERRAVELTNYARHLRWEAQRIAAEQADLSRREAELERTREEAQRHDDSPPAAMSTLRERLAKVQKMKKGLAMLHLRDSAPACR